jgi:hypothetical protein
MKMRISKASWSAVAPATAFTLGINGGSFAAAVQGASRIFMQRGELRNICARNGTTGRENRGNELKKLLKTKEVAF